MVVLSLRLGVHGSELTWRVAADWGRPTLVNGWTGRSADRWVGRAAPPPEALAVKCKDDHRAASVPMLSALAVPMLSAPAVRPCRPLPRGPSSCSATQPPTSRCSLGSWRWPWSAPARHVGRRLLRGELDLSRR